MTEKLKKCLLEKGVEKGISSPEVNLAKAVNGNRKYDYFGEKDLFICEGVWACEKLIRHGIRITHLLTDPSRIDLRDEETVIRTAEYAENVCIISEKTCAKISERDGADSVFVIAKLPSYKLSDLELPEETVTVIMDGLEQPGNVGNILRSADAAGCTFAIMTNSRVKLTHSRLVRSSLGAVFTMKVAEASKEELKKWLAEKNFKTVVTDLKAKARYFEADYEGRVAVVAGNEYNGVSAGWEEIPGALPVIIPMMGECESLNVGFASTLVLYEASVSQKKLRGGK